MKRLGLGILYAALLIPLILSCGGGSSDIKTVKNGTLMLDQSVTVGNALEGYKLFTAKDWKAFSDPQKRRIVEFNGTINLPAIVKDLKETSERFSSIKPTYEGVLKAMNATKECQYYARFVISTDGKQFALAGSGIKYILKDGKVLEGEPFSGKGENMLEGIYKNQENALNLEIYWETPQSLKS